MGYSTYRDPPIVTLVPARSALALSGPASSFAVPRLTPCCSLHVVPYCPAHRALLQPAHRALLQTARCALLPCASRPAAASARPAATTAAATAVAGGGSAGSAGSAAGAGGARGVTGSAGGAAGAGAARGGQRRSLPLPDDPTPQQLREWVLQRARPGGGGFGFLRTAQRRQQSQQETFSPQVLNELFPQRCVTGSVEAAALGASESAAGLGAGESAATLGANESAADLGARASPATGPFSAEALHTFTLDSGASRVFFRDCTTLTPLAAPVSVSLGDPTGGPVVAQASTVLPCPAVPSSSLSCLHLPTFSTNLRVAICTCSRTGRHLTTLSRRHGSSLYTLTTASAQVAEACQVAASSQVSASGQLAASFSCRVLSYQTLLWHHRLDHPSLPRLRGMHSRLLVSGLPRSPPSLPRSPAPPCLPCVEGRQRVASHSSEFPPTTTPLQTLHMDFCRDKGIVQSFTLPASPQKNGIAEHCIGLIMEVARTSMIHVAAPHFLWPFRGTGGAAGAGGVGAARGTPRTPFFEGCSPSPLAPSYAFVAVVDILGAEDVGAASALSGKRRSHKGKGGKSGGGGSGGGGGGGCGGGGGGGGSGGGSGGFGGGGGGGGGGSGGSGSGGSGSGGGGTGGGQGGAVQRGGCGGGQRQQQQRRSETPSPQQLCASESALPGTVPAEALHTFTLDSAASRYFFRNSLCLPSRPRLPRPAFLASRGGSAPLLTPPRFPRRLLPLRERFREDLPVLRLHSDRGGEFSSDLLRDFCRGEGILQSFTLPASSQKNGVAERHIGLVMEVARTSMIHAAAPHFLWPFVVRYAAHQLNLWPRVSLPETSPTLRWTGKVGDASAFRGPAPSGVSQVDPLPLAEPVEVTVDSGAARGVASGGVEPEGAEPGGAESEGAEPGDAESEGAGSRVAEPGEIVSTGGTAGASPRHSRRREPLSPRQLREWFSRCTPLRSGAAGAGGPAAGGTGAGGNRGAGAATPGGARTRGTGAAGAGDPGAGGTGAGGAGVVDPGVGGAGAGVGGTGAGGRRAGGAGARDPGAGGAGVGDPGAGGAGATGVGAGGTGAGGTAQRRPFFVPPPPSSLPPPDLVLCKSDSPLPAPSPYAEQRNSLLERREHVSRPASPVRAVRIGRRVPHPRPPPVLSSSTVTRLLATVVTDPSFESAAASSLVAELVDIAAACRPDYAASLVAEYESDCPPSIGGECALGTDVFEDRQEDFECFATAIPHLVAMLLAPEGDLDAPDIPTLCSYAEAILGPYSSQW
ncbi:unnamed protein product [Closterium sp. NIES-54]